MNQAMQEIIQETVRIVLREENNSYAVMSKDIQDIKKDIQDLKIKSATHALDCPQDKRIETIENDLFEYYIFKKYPKLIATMFVVVIAFSVISFIKSL